MRSKVLWVLGVLGVVISYAKFGEWISANGVASLPTAWDEAFTVHAFAAGLVWDLSITALMLLVLAVWDRQKLGPRWVAGVFVSTIVLGVCMGLAVYVVGRDRKEAEGCYNH